MNKIEIGTRLRLKGLDALVECVNLSPAQASFDVIYNMDTTKPVDKQVRSLEGLNLQDIEMHLLQGTSHILSKEDKYPIGTELRFKTYSKRTDTRPNYVVITPSNYHETKRLNTVEVVDMDCSTPDSKLVKRISVDNLYLYDIKVPTVDYFNVYNNSKRFVEAVLNDLL